MTRRTMKPIYHVLKLWSSVITFGLSEIKQCLHYVNKTLCDQPRNCFVIVENHEIIILYIDHTYHFVAIDNAIKSANCEDLISLKDIEDCDRVLEVYKQSNRLLIVNTTSGNSAVVKGKSNHAFITSVLSKKLTGLRKIERRFEFSSTAHSNEPKNSRGLDIPIILTCTTKTTEIKDQTDTKRAPSKVLPRRTTTVPPSPLPTELDELEYTAFPFHDIRYSIEATDGASSMPSVDCFASSVGSRYIPITRGTKNSTELPLPGRPSRPQPRYREYENLEARRKTFEATDWEKYPNRPTIVNLVEWGFYNTGRFDLVRCFHCGIGLKDWSVEDLARDEHIRHSAGCEFLKEKLGPENLNRLKIQILYEADGGSIQQFASRNYGQGALASSLLTRSDQIATSSTRLQAPPVNPKNGANKNTTPQLSYSVRHPEYQTVESRKATYNNFPHNKQDARNLVIAGFYFTGQGDICRCFCCDGGMQHWDREDDPMREHAQYFPNCGYIRQMKGDEYINTVRHQAGMTEEVATASASKTSQDHQHGDNKDTDIEKKGENVHRQPDKTDIYRSKVVQNVLASGFNKNQVKLAVDSLLNRGSKQFTEDDIVNMILDDPEPGPQLGSDASATDPDEILQENKMLKEFLKCMLCKREDANVLFLPCAHHKVCVKCSENLKKCSFCSETISQKVKTFLV